MVALRFVCNANAQTKDADPFFDGKGCEGNIRRGGCNKSIMVDNTDSELAKLLQNAELVGDGEFTESVDKEGVKTSMYTSEVILGGGSRLVGTYTVSCTSACSDGCAVTGCIPSSLDCTACSCSGQ